MKDVDYFQTLELRISTTMQDIRYLYYLLCEAEREGASVNMEYTNKRLLEEFEQALAEIPKIVSTNIQHSCDDILENGAKLKEEPHRGAFSP